MLNPWGAIPMGMVPQYFLEHIMSIQLKSPASTTVVGFHNHKITDSAQAQKFSTGVLDVELLRQRKLAIHQDLEDCHVVRIRFAAFTMNYNTKRAEPVYDVYSANHNLIGTYFACAFKALMV